MPALPAWGSDSELVIYPGFTKGELLSSAHATLKGARGCASRDADQRGTVKAAVAPYLAAKVADGLSVELQESSVELRCRAEPVRRCGVVYAWQTKNPDLAYASVQCFGSHEGIRTSYLLTASLDLRKARKAGVRGTKKDSAIQRISLAFHTNEFPGTHLSATAEIYRHDRGEVQPVRIQRFDDYQATDEASFDTISGEELLGVVREVVSTACELVGQCRGEGSPPRPSGP